MSLGTGRFSTGLGLFILLMGAMFPLQCLLFPSVSSLLFAHHWRTPVLHLMTNCHQPCTVSSFSFQPSNFSILVSIFGIGAVIFCMFISCPMQENPCLWHVSHYFQPWSMIILGEVFCYTACIIIVDFLSYYPDNLVLRVYYYTKIVYPSKSLSECRFPLIPFQ